MYMYIYIISVAISMVLTYNRGASVKIKNEHVIKYHSNELNYNLWSTVNFYYDDFVNLSICDWASVYAV